METTTVIIDLTGIEVSKELLERIKKSKELNFSNLI